MQDHVCDLDASKTAHCLGVKAKALHKETQLLILSNAWPIGLREEGVIWFILLFQDGFTKHYSHGGASIQQMKRDLKQTSLEKDIWCNMVWYVSQT